MGRLNKVRACFDKAVSRLVERSPEHVEKRGKAEELLAKATAHGSDWSMEKIELEFLKLGYPAKVISNTQGNAGPDAKRPGVRGSPHHDDGRRQIAKYWTPETIEAARHPRHARHRPERAHLPVCPRQGLQGRLDPE